MKNSANKKLQVVIKTRLTDHEVDLMREMYEEFEPGHNQHVGTRKLAAIFGCSRDYAKNITQYRRRMRPGTR